MDTNRSESKGSCNKNATCGTRRVLVPANRKLGILKSYDIMAAGVESLGSLGVVGCSALSVGGESRLEPSLQGEAAVH